MATKSRCSVDKGATMETVRQTVTPPISKIVGEPRSPHLSKSSAGDTVQSTGRPASAQVRPHHKGGRRRSSILRENLVMDACFVGIDVSKNQLDGRILGAQSFQHPNSPAGIAAIVGLLQSLPVTLVVVEATGGLEVPIARALQKAQIPVAVINPRQGRDFAKATGRLAKTDDIDAETLAMFGQAIRPRPQPLPDEQTAALDAIVTRRSQLIDMRTMEQNRLQQTADAKVRRNIQKHLDWLNRHIDDVDRELGEAVKNNPAWQARDQLQQSIPGIGKGVSLALLAGLPELGRLASRKLAALAGLAPFARDSGQSKGKRHIMGGRSHVRAMLFMGAWTASRSKTALGEFYRRLIAKGKAPKVALIAVARKMLTIANAIVRSGQPYDSALHGASLVGA
jgi:transposase